MNSFYGALTSFFFFLTFDKIISPFISRNIPAYKKLSAHQKKEWNSRNNSTVHAVMVTLIGVYVLMFEKSIQKNLVVGYSRIAAGNIEVAIGYLSADFILMAMDIKEWKRNWGYIVHHASAVYAFWFTLRYGLLPYFANFRLLAELSTPFVNLRWALSVTNSKAGPLYFYNGCLMTLSFFLTRIALMPYYYYMVVNVAGTEEYHRHLSTAVHVSWLFVCIVLDILNIMWFRKMLSGLTKYLDVDNKPGNVSSSSSETFVAEKND